MRRLYYVSSILIGGGSLLWWSFTSSNDTPPCAVPVDYKGVVPSRSYQWTSLKTRGSFSDPFDILIIGGGATGAGCCLDAATRGLKTALVERDDFSCGTSSRSTKAVHGGVRYLEKAFSNLDFRQLKLVFEALRERKRILHNAPYLAHSLPFMMPCYQWWEVPYYWAGLKVYDILAGAQGLTWSRFLSNGESKHRFPTLALQKPTGAALKGSVLYYDGQFDDSRLNVTLIATSAIVGATTLNHAECIELLKKDGKVCGAVILDKLTGEKCTVYAKVLINATGPFSDHVRKLADPKRVETVLPSAGVHITLPDYYSPEALGMIVPKTKDGRVVFLLPWQDHTLAGTTDSSSEITTLPKPSEEEVEFILDSIKEYLTVEVRKSDVLSAWSGIRPLAKDPTSNTTEGTLRDHIVFEEDGLVTISGGKWTTYRKMAEDGVDKAIDVGRLETKGPCCTVQLALLGTPNWTSTTFTDIAQNYVVPHRPGAIDTRVAHHLARSYGDRGRKITHIAEERKLGQRIVRGHPILEAEVIYTIHHEYCQTIVDFIARRTRLAFLDTLATQQAIPKVAELMSKELGWSEKEKKQQIQDAQDFMKTFTYEHGEERNERKD